MLPFQMPGAGLSDPQPRMPGAPPPAGKGIPQGSQQPPIPGGMAGLPPIPMPQGGPPPLPGVSGSPPPLPGAGGPPPGDIGGGGIDHEAMRKRMLESGPMAPPPGVSPPQMLMANPNDPTVATSGYPSLADLLAPGFPKPGGMR